MSKGRSLLAGIALGAFALGVVLIGSPSTARAVPLGDGVVRAIGVVAVASGVLVLARRRDVEMETASVPDIEQPQSLPVPGEDVDDLFGEPWAVSDVRAENSRQGELRRRLTEIAVPLVAEAHDCTSEEAMELLADGTWTDDPRAAAFFCRGLPDWAPRSVRLRTVLSGTDPVYRWARHATDELWALSETHR